MFDKDTLAQLSQLKSNIQASKEYGVGHVAGTNGRFGFVRLEDGRDAFLSPDKMQHVIPGDKVKVSLTKNNKDQLEATLESLLEQSLDRFLGQYRITKKGHFVVPLGAAPGMKASPINRWIFLPPKGRNRCKEGDMVVAKLLQHPYRDGKASARVLERIGQEQDAHIERLFVCAKYDLIPRYNDKAQKQVGEIGQQFNAASFGDDRNDYCDIPFVTIDSESTRDMDDAIALKIHGEGDNLHYELRVAIADPASFIPQHSPLSQSSYRNAQSLYLLGGVIPMLPEPLANDCFSLVANDKRPVLCCTINIDTSGAITGFEFNRGVIKSHAKLNYNAVGRFLQGESDTYDELSNDATIASMLRKLAELSELRLAYRRSHNLVAPDQTEYGFELDDKGKICKSFVRERTAAHRIVEEAMLATNHCAGQYLAEINAGVFTTHTGFREDRLGEVKALLKEESVPSDTIDTLEGFTGLINQLSNDTAKQGLVPALRRMMPTSELSAQASAHLGIGMSHYATITSPIRRFADLYNHWAIQNHLLGGNNKPVSDDYLTSLGEHLANGRQAERELQQWLICQYAAQLLGSTGSAKIRIVTQQGFGARLLEHGVDGFILFPKNAEKRFDAKRMTLQVGELTYALEDEIQVKVESVDMDKRRIAFSLQ